ncbi:ComEA family DNA-binding protein [Paeniglutamicibacter sp. ABSL32-1]|uniref:helix-hairpin-helix domain-containing protein n=1 Tax=Paeniglutamicibacter quisquiliarum TaxID=2849498 RepID=UPI001C2D92E9|nr:ComEA family DNA-binding protein [Paeniglutamicibacter quisquiliarum]MBV1778449.1 ComEA family DNA-binding protein [Paeniglutamicibacter quisquiliarum]
MGSHEWVDHATRSNLAPVPGRLRVLIGRSAAIVLILGALTWISVSLLFNPPPRAPGAAESIPLETAPISQANPVPAPDRADAPPVTQGIQWPEEDPQEPGATAPPVAGATAVVHLVGAVKKPGVYSLPLGSRVLDAVDLAGGLAKDAAPEAINLAAQIRDGEQIRIPRRGETGQPPAAGVPAPGTSDGTSGTGTQPGKINVNTADQGQLEELPGIGPSLAGRILEFRLANGPFKNLGELDAVSGIGPALLGNLRERVVFD